MAMGYMPDPPQGDPQYQPCHTCTHIKCVQKRERVEHTYMYADGCRRSYTKQPSAPAQPACTQPACTQPCAAVVHGRTMATGAAHLCKLVHELVQ